jgi:hypothetical protein
MDVVDERVRERRVFLPGAMCGEIGLAKNAEIDREYVSRYRLY